jgi:hypothetical protein
MLNAVMAGKRRGTGLENQKQALGLARPAYPSDVTNSTDLSAGLARPAYTLPLVRLS